MDRLLNKTPNSNSLCCGEINLPDAISGIRSPPMIPVWPKEDINNIFVSAALIEKQMEYLRARRVSSCAAASSTSGVRRVAPSRSPDWAKP